MTAEMKNNGEPCWVIESGGDNAMKDYPLCERMERDTGKNVVSLVNELASKMGKVKIEFTCNEIEENKGVKFFYYTANYYNGEELKGEVCASKKAGKAACARVCVERLLTEIANATFDTNRKDSGDAKNVVEEEESPIPLIFQRDDTFSELLRQHTYAKFKELCKEWPIGVGTDQVIAAIFLLDSLSSNVRIVSLATGNKCIRASYLGLCGQTVNDSHAEILCRRGLLRFFYSQVMAFVENPEGSILRMDEASGKFVVDGRYTFHMFLNTAPCGDSRLYSIEGSDAEDEGMMLDRNKEKLRYKIEDGMGAVLGNTDDAHCATLDGLVAGERLRTQSCSDKFMRWSVLGLQGSLLGNFMQPVYLSTLSIADLFSQRISRAIWGRVEGLHVPEPYSVHKTICMRTQSISRMATSSSKCRVTAVGKGSCVNWNLADNTMEALTAPIGVTQPMGDISRLSRASLFLLFTKIHFTLTGTEVPYNTTYVQVKASNKAHMAAKKQLLNFLSRKELGNWQAKPLECSLFTKQDVERKMAQYCEKVRLRSDTPTTTAVVANADDDMKMA